MNIYGDLLNTLYTNIHICHNILSVNSLSVFHYEEFKYLENISFIILIIHL